MNCIQGDLAIINKNMRPGSPEADETMEWAPKRKERTK